MKVTVAADNNSLKKRVVRFFESQRAVSEFVRDLAELGEVLVFGGFVRDVALYGGRGFYSDIDLVVDCIPSELFSYFVGEDCQRNKYGGYRIDVSGWTVDVWPLIDTWAFKSGWVDFNGRDSLLLTTITTWDAVAYSFKDKQIVSSSSYLECLGRGELDVVLTKNPNPMGAFLRVLRSIYDKDAKVIMPAALRYLQEGFSFWTVDQLATGQLSTFGKVYFTHAGLFLLRDQIFSLKEDLFGSYVKVEGVNFSLNL